MNTLRFNITLPSDVANKLKHVKNKSAVIAESLRERFRKEEEEKKYRLLAEAYSESAKEERSVREEWDTVSGDGL